MHAPLQDDKKKWPVGKTEGPYLGTTRITKGGRPPDKSRDGEKGWENGAGWVRREWGESWIRLEVRLGNVCPPSLAEKNLKRSLLFGVTRGGEKGG